MEYLIVFGTTVAGSGTLLLIMRYLYKRGIAIRITLLTSFITIVLGNVGFMMGKEGLSPMRLALAVGIILPAVTVLHIWILKTLVDPARKIQRFAGQMQLGDLSQELDIHSNDEIGDIARSLILIKDFLNHLANASLLLSKGDLTQTITPRSDMDVLGNCFGEMAKNLRETIGQVTENANRLAAASIQLSEAANQAGMATNQISSTIQQVAVGTAGQSESVHQSLQSVHHMEQEIGSMEKWASDEGQAIQEASEIASWIDEVIKQVSHNTDSVTAGADSATAAARMGRETMDDTLKGMESIKDKVGISAEKVLEMGKRSEEINAIVETIEDIASQTNMLALNAAIEAARAGEHGKGFAVVADEVRKLAERSSLATKDIGTIISSIQATVKEAVSAMHEGTREVENGVASANKAGSALSEILTAAQAVNKQAAGTGEAVKRMSALAKDLVNSVNSVSVIIEENKSAAKKMGGNSAQVTESIEKIAAISEENSAAIEEISASTEEMAAQVEEVSASSQSLADLARSLQQVVKRFMLNQA